MTDRCEIPKRLSAVTDAPRRLPSKELFGTGSEVVIQHGAEQYRLRITRQGKLILTK